jgi:hypothetical protein
MRLLHSSLIAGAGSIYCKKKTVAYKLLRIGTEMLLLILKGSVAEAAANAGADDGRSQK